MFKDLMYLAQHQKCKEKYIKMHHTSHTCPDVKTCWTPGYQLAGYHSLHSYATVWQIIKLMPHGYCHVAYYLPKMQVTTLCSVQP